MTTPDFIIIGAMKSATSSLHTQLAAQSGIFMSSPKEPNFFSDDEQYRHGTDWYLSLFSDAPEGSLCGESSTHYTKLPDFPQTVGRMKALLPDLKLIYVMRDPIDRLVSHYIHAWTDNTIRCGIDEALDKHPELIDYGRYGYQLAPYLQAYGNDSILPMFFGAVKKHPQRELARVARFIGHPRSVTWQQGLGAQNVSTDRVRQFWAYQLLVDSPLMELLRRTLVPQAVRDAVKARFRMEERPTLSDSSINRLESIFDEDLRALSNWLGIELTCRTFDERTSAEPLEWTA